MLDEAFGQELTGTLDVGPFARLRFIVRPGAKRLFDVTAAMVLLVVTSPIIVLIMVMILCTLQSPFYSHVRIGRGGREFGCLKFRSMRRNSDIVLAELLKRDPAARAEWETKRKLRMDPRITRIGKVLRSTSLDEVPQLFNVLAGEMSLVGPRPVTRDEFAKFYDAGEAATCYKSIRPGLTGLWQVSGRSETHFATRVALDTQYAQRLSLRADLAILFRTLSVVVSQRGAW